MYYKTALTVWKGFLIHKLLICTKNKRRPGPSFAPWFWVNYYYVWWDIVVHIQTQHSSCFSLTLWCTCVSISAQLTTIIKTRLFRGVDKHFARTQRSIPVIPETLELTVWKCLYSRCFVTLSRTPRKFTIRRASVTNRDEQKSALVVIIARTRQQSIAPRSFHSFIHSLAGLCFAAAFPAHSSAQCQEISDRISRWSRSPASWGTCRLMPAVSPHLFHSL